MTIDAAVTAMASGASRDRVGLVVRWNSDDTKIRTLWSELAFSAGDIANPTPGERPMMFRRNDDANPALGIRSVTPIGDRAGLHAEEILIACWPALLASVHLTDAQVHTVELVLSKSPCTGSQGSSPLIVNRSMPGAGVVAATQYDAGCASKLHTFCGARRNIKFTISYLAMAGAHTNDYTAATRGQLGGVKRFMTNEESALDPDRVNFARSSEALSRHESTAKTIDSQFTAAKTDNNVQALRALGSQFAAVKKQANQAKRLVDASVGPARIESLHLAQAGIAKLQSLVNVDVVRWGFMQSSPSRGDRPRR